jgi:hypothetical protein
VGEPTLPKLLACLQHSFTEVKEDNVLTMEGCVKPVYATHIQFTVISYLNSLEVVMSAWKHSIADRAIITEEFQFLWDQKERKAALENFRKAVRDSSQVEVFPGILEFINDLRHEPPAGNAQVPTPLMEHTSTA